MNSNSQVESVRSLPTMYQRAFIRVDEYVERERSRYPSHVQCRRGCAECCLGTFPVTLADTAMVRIALANLPENARCEALTRAEAMLDHARIDLYTALHETSDSDHERGIELIDSLPCPFLAHDNACRIYQSRPLVCRLHGLPIKSADGNVLDAGCHLDFIDVDIATLEGFVFDDAEFDEIEDFVLNGLADIYGMEADTELLLPVALLHPAFDRR